MSNTFEHDFRTRTDSRSATGPVRSARRPAASGTTRSPVPQPSSSAELPIRVTLVRDDELTARGLSSILREHPDQIELVSLSGPRAQTIDIALYDPAVRRTDRPTLRQLLADPGIRKVALFTWNFQPWAAAGLIEQGACAYLHKGLASRELVEALQAVHTGRVLIASGQRSSGAPLGLQAERGEVLTEREAEVLSLISGGLSNTDIAGTLNLSVNTVKSYIRTCYRKIDVESRSKAVLWALGHGYASDPVPDTSSQPAQNLDARQQMRQPAFAS